MSTINDSDLLLVERNGNLHQITYDQMSTLNDDDILLVERGGVQYKVEAQYVSTGPNGVILPSVEVLTPVNGAGLNEGDPYTPISSAYVSTDSTPVYHRYFAETVTTVSGGSWANENNIHDGNSSTYAELTGAAGVVSQVIYTPVAGWSNYNYTVYAYATGGGTIEVLDDTDTVLRSYTLSSYASSVDVGIFRNDQRIRITTQSQNTSLFIGHLQGAPTDYVISGRVAFEFADDTDLDKMVAPIIMTDADGNVKVPTTSTVDSTSSVSGRNMWADGDFYGSPVPRAYFPNIYYTDRMLFAKVDSGAAGMVISDTVATQNQYLQSTSSSQANPNGPQLTVNGNTTYPEHPKYNIDNIDTHYVELGVAPKILDIVTWNGNSSALHEIPHNLGTKPGMILAKCVSSGGNWMVWHKDQWHKYVLSLQNNQGQYYSPTVFPTEPTNKSFFVGDSSDVNQTNRSYVAYVFAADTPGKIKCGTYEGNGSTSSRSLNVGFIPGIILVKNLRNPYSWVMTYHALGGTKKYWRPNEDSALTGNSDNGIQCASVIEMFSDNPEFNSSGHTYVYLAINNNLTSINTTTLNLLSGQDLEYFDVGTQVTSNLAASGSRRSFSSVTYSGNGGTRQINPYIDGQYFFDTGHDAGNKWLIWIKCTDSTPNHVWIDSERHPSQALMSNRTVADNGGYYEYYRGSSSNGYNMGNGSKVNAGGSNYIAWNFLGAPQFFDVQKYVGDGGYQTIQHDLGVEPGFIIIKSISSSSNWICYHSELGGSNFLELNTNSAPPGGSNRVRSVTDADFDLGPVSTVNATGKDYIAYIFAKDTPYVKCGKYTGAGANTQVNIGFKPRWMLIKRIDTTGDWIILDKNRSGTMMYANSNQWNFNLNFTFNATGVTIGHDWSGTTTQNGQYIYIAIADESEGHPPNFPSTSTVVSTNPDSYTMRVSASSFDVGDSVSAAPIEASITSIGGSEGNKLFVDASTGNWMPGLYAKGTQITLDAPSPDEITFTSQNQGTPEFSGVDATLASRTWTLESGTTSTGPWTVVDSYVDYDVLNSQDGSTPWTSNKPNLTPNTFYRVKVQYNSTNAESVESVYSTFKTGSN